MLPVIISVSVVILVAGIVAVIHSAKHAVTGYEDDFGFHEGEDPRGKGIDFLVPRDPVKAPEFREARLTTREDSFVDFPIDSIGDPTI